MAWLRKTRGVPGSAPGGLVWNTPEDVREVDDALAADLLEIPDAGFVSVSAPEPADHTQAEPDGTPQESGETPAKSTAKKTTAPKAAAAKTPAAE